MSVKSLNYFVTKANIHAHSLSLRLYKHTPAHHGFKRKSAHADASLLTRDRVHFQSPGISKVNTLSSNLTMITLAGYQILTQIYESANSLVYRAIRERDNQSVILKVLKEDYPTPQELTRYKQEYEITRNLNLDGVVKAYSLEPYQRSLVIILEDFGASSLKQSIDDRVEATYALPLPQFLKIAIQIADVLGKIHGA